MRTGVYQAIMSASTIRAWKFIRIILICALIISLTCLYFYTKSRANTASEDYVQSTLRRSKVQRMQAVFPGGRSSVVHEQMFTPMVIPFTRNATFDYRAAMQRLNEAKVSQDDPRLIKLIRDYYIDPPSNLEYNLDNPNSLEYSMGQTPFVDSRLNYIVSFILRRFLYITF